MIIRAINSNRIGAYLIVLLCAIVSWIRPLVSPIAADNTLSVIKMPFWQSLELLLSSSEILASFIVMFFGLVMAFAIARFSLRHNLLNKQTALPAFMFVLCVAAFPQSQTFTPSWIAALALLVSSSLIYESHSKRKPAIYCFLAAFWMAAASLFYYKAIFIYPLLFIIIITVRSFNFKSLLATILGFLLPWYLYFGLLYVQGADVMEVAESFVIKKEMFLNYAKLPLQAWINFALLGLFVLMAFISIAQHYNTKKIFIRVLYKVLVITTVYLTVVASIIGYSFESIPIIAVPVSILFAHLFDNIKSVRWQNILMLILMGVVIVSQILM